MHLVGSFILLVGLLTPTKNWYAPSAAVNVSVKPEGDSKLVLTDFKGTTIAPKQDSDVKTETTVDLAKLYPQITVGGAYVLYLQGKDKPLAQFQGTPLVIEARDDKRDRQSGPVVINVQPLRYATIKTAHGDMTAIFYYDVAPHTADSFLTLASQGYFDGLLFHRIVPGFVLQGGDPKGDGSGGPGYTIMEEFNDRPHEEGVLSMARLGDPNEGAGARPRSEFANSAGSQFFICLDYAGTKSLDGKYTAFGKIVDGMKVAHEIEKAKLSNPESGVAAEPQAIEKVTVSDVTADHNPYKSLLLPNEK